MVTVTGGRSLPSIAVVVWFLSLSSVKGWLDSVVVVVMTSSLSSDVVNSGVIVDEMGGINNEGSKSLQRGSDDMSFRHFSMSAVKAASVGDGGGGGGGGGGNGGTKVIWNGKMSYGMEKYDEISILLI